MASPLLKSALEQFVQTKQGTGNLSEMLKKHLIEAALIKAHGNQTKAAKMLGINRGTLKSYLSK